MARSIYCVFGLTVACDRPLAGLVPMQSPVGTGPNVHIHSHLGPHRRPDSDARPPAYVSPLVDASGLPRATGWALEGGAFLWLRLSDGAEFVVDRGGTEIWIGEESRRPGATEEYLLGPILALALRFRGEICLHGSVVAIGTSAIAFVGAEGVGKSTLAAIFALRGGDVLTDDLIVIRETAGRGVVERGPAFVRVRPGVIEHVAAGLGRAHDLRRTADGAYFDLPIDGRLDAGKPRLPLAAIYCLELQAPQSAPGSFELIVGARAALSLLANSWASTLLDGRNRSAELADLTRLAMRVPVIRVPICRGADAARAVAARIAADVDAGCLASGCDDG